MKRLKSYILFILLLLATVLPAHGHISRNMFMISNLNTDNGLSSSRVYSSISLGRTRWANCSSMFIMQRYKIL